MKKSCDICSFVVEGSKATPPSHVRVSFELDPTKRHLYSSLEFHGLDGDDTSSTQSEDVSTYSGMESGKNNMKQMAYSRIPQRVQAKALKTYSTVDQNGIGQLEIRCHRSVSSANKIITLRELRDKIISKEEFSSDVLNGASPLIGETSEPFWIQQSPDQQWEEPDVICNCNIDKLITLEDKRILWEMISLLIEFPDYYRGIEGHSLDSSETSCRSEVSTLDTIPTLSNLSNPTELALIFHRKEYQVLWALEAPDYLPLAATQDLIRFAFCSLK